MPVSHAQWSSDGEDGVPLDEERTIEPEPAKHAREGERGIDPCHLARRKTDRTHHARSIPAPHGLPDCTGGLPAGGQPCAGVRR
jgi:hypothetical protein